MSNPYAICREKLGAAPRTFARAQKKILAAKTPPWSKTDALGCVVRDRELLLREGRIAPGVLVQANQTLWQMGENTSAAIALWTEDARLETDMRCLRELALELKSFKGLSPETVKQRAPEMVPFAREITDETSSPLNMKLPADWGMAGAQFYMSALLVWRTDLPARYLTSRLIPLLVLPERTNSTLILPGLFWADALKDC